METETEPGLRARKKAETLRSLHQVTLRLAVAGGWDSLTVEAIADAAGVSRRTFSNYFPNKEAALFHGDNLRMRMLLDALGHRPAGEPHWAALRESAREIFALFGTGEPSWVAQVQLLKRHPALAAAQATKFAAQERDLTAALQERDPDLPVLRARLMATVFLSLLRVATGLWLDGPDGVVLLDVVEQLMDEAGTGFR